MININLAPDFVFNLFGIYITNTLLTSLIVSILLISLSLYFYYKNAHDNIVIKIIRVIVYELINLTDEVTEDRQLSKRVVPLIATFFLFIFTCNLITLIPGFLNSFYVNIDGIKVSLLRSPNSDLNTTVALAIVSVITIQYFSIKHFGFGGYIARFINFTNPIKFITGFFEMISEGIKVLSFSFRLFGNVFAGEVLLVVIAFLIPYLIPIPFMILEVFVGIIQAFIFAMLSLTFVKTGMVKEEVQETNSGSLPKKETLQSQNLGQ